MTSSARQPMGSRGGDVMASPPDHRPPPPLSSPAAARWGPRGDPGGERPPHRRGCRPGDSPGGWRLSPLQSPSREAPPAQGQGGPGRGKPPPNHAVVSHALRWAASLQPRRLGTCRFIWGGGLMPNFYFYCLRFPPSLGVKLGASLVGPAVGRPTGTDAMGTDVLRHRSAATSCDPVQAWDWESPNQGVTAATTELQAEARGLASLLAKSPLGKYIEGTKKEGGRDGVSRQRGCQRWERPGEEIGMSAASGDHWTPQLGHI